MTFLQVPTSEAEEYQARGVNRVNGEGSKTARIAIIGEAPGTEENKHGRPFIGPAGGVLDQCLHAAGITRAECYVTNLIKYKQSGNDVSKFFTPGKGLTSRGQECQEELFAELASVDANVLVACGAPATCALTGLTAIEKYRGYIFSSRESGDRAARKVIPVIHPAATIYGSKKVKSSVEGRKSQSPYVKRYYIIHDLQKAKRHSFSKEYKPPHRTLIHEPSLDEALASIERLRNASLLSVDIEVTRNNQVYCIGLSDSPDFAISIPLQDYWTLNEEMVIWRAVASLLEDDSIAKVGQNFAFDIGFLLYADRVLVRGTKHDTMYAHHLMYPDFAAGLDFLGSIYTDEPYWKGDGKTFDKNAKGFHPQTFRQYNAKDAAVTLECWQKFSPELRTGEYYHTYEFTQDLMEPFIFFSTHGIKVNHERLAHTKKEVEAQITEAEAELTQLCGRYLNATSPKDCQRYFYDELNFPPYYNIKHTAKGIVKTVTTDDKAMQRLAKGTTKRKGRPEASLVQRIRGLKKLRGTYLEMNFDPDGRFRTQVNMRGTTTGRQSTGQTVRGTGGNVQNIPEEVRTFFEADTGFIFLEIDLERAEWVCVANFAGDANMLRTIAERRDPHASTASLMCGVPISAIEEEAKLVGHSTDPHYVRELREQLSPSTREALGEAKFLPRVMSLRQMGKKSNHGLNYDERAAMFALVNEIEESEAAKYVEAYHEIYPNIRTRYYEWIKQQLRDNRRTIVNPFGRKRTFKDRWGDGLFKEAYAHLPQSTVVDRLNQGINFAYYNQGKRYKPWCLKSQNHDSMLFQLPADNHYLIAATIEEISSYLSSPITWGVRVFHIECAASCGKTWGGLHPLPLHDPYMLRAQLLERCSEVMAYDQEG